VLVIAERWGAVLGIPPARSTLVPMESSKMRTIRMTICSLVATAGLWGVCGAASAQGLVGFYVYPDLYRRGVVVSSFIPGSSADNLHWQGQLMPGDIITRYNGHRVYSAAQIRQISYYSNGGWLRMDFLTPSGQPFWHWVRPGGGSSPACAKGTMSFRKGSSRPGSRPGSVRPPNGPYPGPGRPDVGRPEAPIGAGRPGGPGRP
jgi:hypothetical protein